MIGDRYFANARDSLIDSVDSEELDMIDRGLSVAFVKHLRNRTNVGLPHACMMWNTLRIRLGYDPPPEAQS